MESETDADHLEDQLENNLPEWGSRVWVKNFYSWKG